MVSARLYTDPRFQVLTQELNVCTHSDPSYNMHDFSFSPFLNILTLRGTVIFTLSVHSKEHP
jgi:hypothetical protein